MFSLLKQLFVLLALLATLGLGYFLYTQNSSGLENSTHAGGSAAVALEAADFLSRLNELKTIELDSTVFSDPRFSYLTDFSKPVEPEAVGGRSNPFNDAL